MKNPKVDFFFAKATQWRKEYEKLRMIILDCGLLEDLKWGVPCYTDPAGSSGNIVLIHGFKEYCALLFHKGALLSDPEGILIQQTKNVQAARQVRFKSVREIAAVEKTLKAYIYEAIEVEKLGLKVELKETKQFSVPKEFQNRLDEDPALKSAFKSLTPGRQRGYLLYFAQPKQSKTRESRIKKYIPAILKGRGLNDK
jgi:uncharacterized protein YdeI (YjbR/CyaY-like superfamily)